MLIYKLKEIETQQQAETLAALLLVDIWIMAQQNGKRNEKEY